MPLHPSDQTPQGSSARTLSAGSGVHCDELHIAAAESGSTEFLGLRHWVSGQAEVLRHLHCLAMAFERQSGIASD